jgi:accessory gene regulator protein AgrB
MTPLQAEHDTPLDPKAAQLAWDLFTELRKELVESQKLRSQIIGFKITFVSTGIGVIATNLQTLSADLLVIPAFAAIFFDLLIVSYSFSIKRIGFFCRYHLEPVLRAGYHFPPDTPLWQEFMQTRRASQGFSISGNIGITVLAVVTGVIGLFVPFQPFVSTLLMLALIALVGLDIWAFLTPRRFRDRRG